MKKLLTFIICASFLLTLSGCKGKESDDVVIKNLPETIWLGETAKLTGQYNGDDGRYYYEWESSNPKVASVVSSTDNAEVLYSEAELTALERGTTVITLKIYINGKNSSPVYKSYALKVITELDLPDVQDFGFDFFSLKLKTGEKYQLQPTLYPSDAMFKSDVVYKSEDPSVATVDILGNVTGISKGETIISMTYNGKTLDIEVKVLSVSDSIDVRVNTGDGYVLNPETVYIEREDTAYFTVKFNPEGTDTVNYVAYSGDEMYLSVGTKSMTALTQGETTLTIQCTDYPSLKRIIKVVITDEDAQTPRPYDPTNKDDPYGMNSELESSSTSESE